MAAGMAFLMGMCMTATVVFAEGEKRGVNLSVSNLRYDADASQIIVEATVTNNSEFTIPNCYVTFAIQNSGKLVLHTESSVNWVSAVPEGYTESEDEKTVQMSWVNMLPRDAREFTVSFGTDIPETEEKELLENHVSGTIRIENPNDASWNSSSVMDIPIRIYSMVKETEPETTIEETTVPETTSAPEETTEETTTEAEKKLSAESVSEGSAEEPAEPEQVVINENNSASSGLLSSGPLTATAGEDSSAAELSRREKWMPWIISGILILILIIIRFIAKFVKRYFAENRRKFDPDKKGHGTILK